MQKLKTSLLLAGMFSATLFANEEAILSAESLPETITSPIVIETLAASEAVSTAVDALTAMTTETESTSLQETPVATEAAPASQDNTPAGLFIEAVAAPFVQGNSPSMSGSSRPSSNCMQVEERPMYVQVGGNYTYVTMSPRNNNSFSGSLGGAQALFEYKKHDYLYGGAKFAWRMGNMTGDDGDRSMLDIDIEPRVGYTASGVCCHGHPWTVTPFTGFGFRYLKETVPTLSFEYDEFYIPVGLLTQYQFTSCFAMGLDLTWMPQVYPTVFIDPLKGARWITTHQIGNVLVELPMTFNVYNKYNLTMVVKPFFEFWQDGKTTAVTATGIDLGIPGNFYYFAGVDVNLGYSF